MSEENLKMVRKAFEAFNRGDTEESLADIAPECEYIASGKVPGRSGTYKGPEGYGEFIGWLRSEFDDAHIRIDELLDAGSMVVVGATAQGRGKRSGISSTTFSFWQVWTAQRGKFVRGQGFSSRTEALEAAGLSE
jgi:ketosteroid isomerase-like protein